MASSKPRKSQARKSPDVPRYATGANGSSVRSPKKAAEPQLRPGELGSQPKVNPNLLIRPWPGTSTRILVLTRNLDFFHGGTYRPAFSFLRNQEISMRLSTFSISSLLAASLLGLMVLSPSNAQTSSESEGRELGAFALGAGTINPGIPETGPYAATPTPETHEKVESRAQSLNPPLAATPPRPMRKPKLSQARSLNPIPPPPNPNPKLPAPTRNQPKTVLRF